MLAGSCGAPVRLLWVRREVRGDGHGPAVAFFPYPSDTVAESASAAGALCLDVSQLQGIWNTARRAVNHFVIQLFDRDSGRPSFWQSQGGDSAMASVAVWLSQRSTYSRYELPRPTYSRWHWHKRLMATHPPLDHRIALLPPDNAVNGQR